MKNQYIRPITEKFSVQVEKSLLGTSQVKTLNRYTRWGNPFWDDYGNESWVNEGHTPPKTFTNYPFESIIIDDNNGTLDSRSKGGLWADD